MVAISNPFYSFPITFCVTNLNLIFKTDKAGFSLSVWVSLKK